MNSYIRRLLARSVKPNPTRTVRRTRARLGADFLEDRLAPAVFTVLNTADTGAGSFRQALIDSIAATTADQIVFDPTTFATAQTISLTTALPQITAAGGDLTITGPGATLLTVTRSGTAGAFRIFDSLVNNLTMTGFTVSGGSIAGDGAGLQTSGICTLDGMVFKNNTATGGNDGGAIRVNSGAFLFLKNSTLSGNSAGENGGAIYFFSGGGLVVENSTISGNTAGASNGSGVYPFFGAPGR